MSYPRLMSRSPCTLAAAVALMLAAVASAGAEAGPASEYPYDLLIAGKSVQPVPEPEEGEESPELRRLRELDMELFPPVEHKCVEEAPLLGGEFGLHGGEVKDLAYGLDHETIGAMLNTLPIELSFVDADDTVRYFSHENHPKIFPRTRGAIGMKVQNCHPRKSVHLVNRILEDFKAGRREVAEFWIKLQGTEVHIRYWPVLGTGGEYLGCLETVQDITPIKALSGERRLLDES